LWLRNIQISNFRNFSHFELEFSPTLNLFEGGNAQGKTNLLEAIYCLGRGTSFRTSTDQIMIKWNRDTLYLSGEGEIEGNFHKYEFSLSRDSGKIRRVNSHRVSIGNTSYWLWMVVFSARDIRIIQAGPGYRRNFLDELLFFTSPGFSHIRFSFNKVLSQRNALLGLAGEKGGIEDKNIEVWDSQFLELGSKIIYLRLMILRKLESVFCDIYRELTGLNRSCQFIYSCSFFKEKNNNYSIEDIKEIFSSQLKKIRSKELKYRVSLIGPHRDDFRIIISGIDQRIFGSQGEQKIASIALRLAEVALVREIKKEQPIVLLDDVTSDLDPPRERFLLEALKDKGQIFLTTVDLSRFYPEFLSGSLIFHIENGKVFIHGKR